VSHELRTPITSIKGFVETLQDGAMDQPEEAERFLEILAKQSDRLNAIVEDLLTLSRLEHEAEESGVPLEEGTVYDVLEIAVQVCEGKAEKKGIQIQLRCGNHLTAKMNAPLLEQAVVNLIDNAVKFSPSEREIWVEARHEKRDLVIHVRDKGSGIAAKHLPRLFERFYRVDKARSQKLGGTGLGLAIVKHIALLHRGRVYVDSTPGEGSTFSHYFPKA
jgi:two-component system phosphate regulon sensor histidine kinase PhoR